MSEHPAQAFDMAVGKDLLKLCTPENQVPLSAIRIDKFAQETVGLAMKALADEVLSYLKGQEIEATREEIRQVMSNQYMKKSCHIVGNRVLFKFELPDVADIVVEIPSPHWKYRLENSSTH